MGLILRASFKNLSACLGLPESLRTQAKFTKALNDGWTVETKDGRNSAQWEHTILVTSEGAEVLTKRSDENF